MKSKELSIPNLKASIDRLHSKYKRNKNGDLATYIPELSKVNKNHFGISITTVDGENASVGDCTEEFTIQSISKPFVFGMALQQHGLARVRSKVGVEPTGAPFNSMIRLQEKSKRPSNPLVNTGAIAMSSLIKGKTTTASLAVLRRMYRQYTGRSVKMDKDVYLSEKETGHRNRAMAHLMLHFNMVDAKVEDTLNLYFRQCSFDVTAKDLSVMAATLANDGINPITGERVVDKKFVKHILTLMLTCGMYTYAGEWAFNVGLPAKSGVSGGILAVVPGKMGIGTYSPLIDHHGNSVRGVKVYQELAKEFKLHVLENY